MVVYTWRGTRLVVERRRCVISETGAVSDEELAFWRGDDRPQDHGQASLVCFRHTGRCLDCKKISQRALGGGFDGSGIELSFFGQSVTFGSDEYERYAGSADRA